MPKYDKVSEDIFSYADVAELIDIQPDKKDYSKAYQIKHIIKFSHND